ncbi:24413_t:CDS:2 [Dentiscutata erythropus]|uniref:24413_t:CDS:1 n=1 Tax=Dentiscutata erythropus TaxID=1348616 RepID=A0A9N9A738_9GLOM|nr:24413_t:CDS:2 [Dentiscutata erythropus]
MKPLNLFNSNSQPSFESVNNNHWDLLTSSFYHTLYNSLPFRLLVFGNQNLPTHYCIYYFSPIYTNLKQYSITNLLLAYTLPLLYIFSPTLIVPAIFIRSLQFFASKTAAIGSSLTSNRTRSTLFNLSSINSSSSSSQRSDNGGEGDMTSAQDIEYWLQRCSICFDAQLDFCLELCRDQFCRDCFQRYVKEVVQNSWGLGITKVKCPVCQDIIQQSEWSKYVDQNIIDLYNTYNKPYRSFSRCCSECGEEVFAAQVFQVCAEEKEKYFKEISILLRKYFDTYGSGKNCKGKGTLNRVTKNQSDIDSFLEKYQADYLAYISGEDPKIGVMEMYEYIAKKLGESLGLSMDVDNRRPSKFSRRKLKTHADMVKSAAEISSRIVALEVRPDAWKELQFMHVANFPQSHCTRCNNDICLQCGESTHHPGMTCIQFMRYKVANPHLFILNHCHVHNDALENIKWKLANSKSCPNCSILINRDDGCNKVDCLHCGYRFCWICRNRWSENCGFYKCRMAKSKRKRDKEKYPVGSQRQRTSQFKRQAQMHTQEVASENSEVSGEAGHSQEIRDDVEMPEIGVPNVFMIQSKLISNSNFL